MKVSPSIKNKFIAISIKIISILIIFLFNFLIAFLYEASESGLILYQYNTIIFLGTIFIYGFNKININELSGTKNENLQENISRLNNSFIFLILMTFMVFFIFYLASEIISITDLYLAICVFLYSCVLYLGTQLQAVERFTESIIIQNLLFSSFLVLFIILTDVYYLNFIYIYLLSIGMTILISLGICRNHIRYFDITSKRYKINYIFPFFIVNTSEVTLLTGGVYISSFLLSASDFAVLNIYHKTSSIFLIFLIFINIFVSPRFSSLYKNKEIISFKKLYKKSILMLFLFCIPIYLIFFIFKDLLFSYFGDEYNDINGNFLVILTAFLFYVVTGPTTPALIYSGKQKQLAMFNIINSFLMLSFVSLSSYYFSITGSIYAIAVFLVFPKLALLIYYIRINKNEYI